MGLPAGASAGSVYLRLLPDLIGVLVMMAPKSVPLPGSNVGKTQIFSTVVATARVDGTVTSYFRIPTTAR